MRLTGRRRRWRRRESHWRASVPSCALDAGVSSRQAIVSTASSPGGAGARQGPGRSPRRRGGCAPRARVWRCPVPASAAGADHRSSSRARRPRRRTRSARRASAFHGRGPCCTVGSRAPNGRPGPDQLTAGWGAFAWHLGLLLRAVAAASLGTVAHARGVQGAANDLCNGHQAGPSPCRHARGRSSAPAGCGPPEECRR